MTPRRSAGIVLWRTTPNGHEVLLGHMGGPLWATKDERAWSIPKGEYEAEGPAAEDPLDAAYREFAEELGSAVPPGEAVPLGEVRQRNGKIVTAWAVEGELDVDTVASNTFEMEWPPRSGRRQAFPRSTGPRGSTSRPPPGLLVAGQVAFLDRLPWVDK